MPGRIATGPPRSRCPLGIRPRYLLGAVTDAKVAAARPGAPAQRNLALHALAVPRRPLGLVTFLRALQPVPVGFLHRLPHLHPGLDALIWPQAGPVDGVSAGPSCRPARRRRAATPSRGSPPVTPQDSHSSSSSMIRYQTDDEGVVSQPEYTLTRPSNGPNDRDHLTRQGAGPSGLSWNELSRSRHRPAPGKTPRKQGSRRPCRSRRPLPPSRRADDGSRTDDGVGSDLCVRRDRGRWMNPRTFRCNTRARFAGRICCIEALLVVHARKDSHRPTTFPLPTGNSPAVPARCRYGRESRGSPTWRARPT